MKLTPSSAAKKRAKNMIWAAAGEYGFAPEFLAFGADGEPDPYMNCVVGLACKWLGRERLRELFASYAADPRREELHQILWLGLENYAYEREAPRRPVLPELREQYAREILAIEKGRTEVRWTQWNTLPHNLQNAHIRRILGEDYCLPSPKEEALSRRLVLSGALSPEEAVRELRAVLEDAVRDPGRPPSAFRIKAGQAVENLRRLVGRRRLELRDQLRLPEKPQEEAGEGRRPKRRREAAYAKEAQAQREIEAWFGRSALSGNARADLERELCTGNHAECHLWVTRGEGSRPPEAIAAYRQRNREYFDGNRPLIDRQIRALTARLMGVIQPRQIRTPIPARSGRLSAQEAWRAACFPDPALFQSREMDVASDFSVTLLLDGSESRMDQSAAVAAQGYIVAESLRRCRVPVQVLSFCSLKGFTVMQVLKPYEELHSCRGVLRYSAVGMNRDGLALRAAGSLSERSPCPGRILLALTDAMPMDHAPVPTLHPMIQASYEDELAVRDTAGEVRRLREGGVRVGAVFMGIPKFAKNAAVIYGGELAAIHDITGFPEAVGKLLEKQIAVVG